MYAQELLIKSFDNEVNRLDTNAYVSPYKQYDETLEQIFTSDKDSSKIQTLKRLLNIPELSDSELKSILADFIFLSDTWLDMFERSIFQGNTLQDLLKGEVM